LGGRRGGEGGREGIREGGYLDVDAMKSAVEASRDARGK